MKKWTKRCMAIILAFALAATSGNFTGMMVQPIYAATVQNIATSTQVVCNRIANVKVPTGYKGCKFTSSNTKVATVNAKGKVKALRLGVTTITMRSGAKKKSYTITVVPEKKSDVRLNQELLLKNQKVKLKLVSDKYDTSQVKLRFSGAFSQIDKNGNCKGINSYIEYGTLRYAYGQFMKSITLYICDPEVFFASITDCPYNTNLSEINAGEQVAVLSDVKLETKTFSLQQYQKMGIRFYLDGKPMQDKETYAAGRHVVSIMAGNKQYPKEFYVSYCIKDTLVNKDATGYSQEAKTVFDAAFAAVDQNVKQGMSEEEKVKAIHDYLIYSANYVNNGNYESAENWAYGAEGVLIHKEGVCQSYAIAFYMMAVAAGLDCRYVTGTADGGGHAWNQVKVDGKWYYIDCTWDDPIVNGQSGGGENDTYYLSEKIWPDHIVERAVDLADAGKYSWEHYYLTGEGY